MRSWRRTAATAARQSPGERARRLQTLARKRVPSATFSANSSVAASASQSASHARRARAGRLRLRRRRGCPGRGTSPARPGAQRPLRVVLLPDAEKDDNVAAVAVASKFYWRHGFSSFSASGRGCTQRTLSPGLQHGSFRDPGSASATSCPSSGMPRKTRKPSPRRRSRSKFSLATGRLSLSQEGRLVVDAEPRVAERAVARPGALEGVCDRVVLLPDAEKDEKPSPVELARDRHSGDAADERLEEHLYGARVQIREQTAHVSIWRIPAVVAGGERSRSPTPLRR